MFPLNPPVYESLLLLADPVDPADGLELLGGVEEGLGQDDVARLHQVQTVGALADRHQQHPHVLAVLRRKEAMDGGGQDFITNHCPSLITFASATCLNRF